MVNIEDVLKLDATEQAALIRDGDVKAAELVEAAIRRSEAMNSSLNAIVHERFDAALREAASPNGGPFAGVPIVLKDLRASGIGEPFTGGMRAARDAAYRATEDGRCTIRLRNAGFVAIGRTNTPELGLLPTTEPEAFGPTRNPWDVTRSTGGSSGGSGAAVAAGMVAVGHGTDMGGSIRIPASECGLVGLKPSRGRVYAGVLPLNVEGVLTRTVRDSAAVLDVLAGSELGDLYVAPPADSSFASESGREPRRLKIGLRTRAPHDITTTHPDCVAAAENAARVLESLGHVVEESSPSALDEPELVLHLGLLMAMKTVSELRSWEERLSRTLTEGDMEPHTWAMAELGRGRPAEMLYGTYEWVAGYSKRMESWFDDFDILLTPTIAEPPPKLGEMVAPRDNPLAGGLRAAALVPFTPPFNASGNPAISLPLHWNDDDLPIGVQLIAPWAREHILLRVASQVELAAPWAHRRPPDLV